MWQSFWKRNSLSLFNGPLPRDHGRRRSGNLLPDKLVFVPHRLNFSHKKAIRCGAHFGLRVTGLFGTGLKMVLKSGKTERFAVDSDSDLYMV
jgi:hypothetical protein